MDYSTDLTHAEFGIIEPLLPKTYIQRRPPKWTKHQILNGIFYQLINGCKCADLPKDLPPPGTVFYWFNQWKNDGTWERINKEIFVKSRINQRKKSANTVTLRLPSRRQ
jgi:transposase